jgi:hypothetical protein
MASLIKFDLPLLDYNKRILLRQVKIHVVVAHPNLDVSLEVFRKKDQKDWTEEEKHNDPKNILQEVLKEKTASKC